MESTTELKRGMLLKHGEYRIERVLGQGGFGITYEAEQVSLGRKVAVKEFYMKEHCNRDGGSKVSVPSTGSRELVEKFRDKFIREARMLAGFDHQSIVRVIDVFEENGTAYYVMEYLDGGTLQRLVNDKGRLGEDDALKYIAEVAGALEYIHSRDTLHLDVKPGNIMLDGEGRAVLIDFGISKHVDVEGHLTSSTPLGISKGYAPFEQVAQEASSTYSAATDIYSLGATLYFLLTGKRPPEPSVLMDGFPIGDLESSGVSSCTINAIKAAMQVRKKDRPQSVEEFLELLDGKIEGGNAGSCGGETGAEDGTLTYGTLRVNSRPDGANVFVDGVQIGSTKGSLETRLEPGTHIVQIEKGGYDAVERNVAITAGLASEIRAELARRKPVISAAAIISCMVAALLVLGLFLWRPWKPQQTVQQPSTTTNTETSSSGKINGHEYVDLGLSVKWATCNVGASSPEGYGDYFAWGETRPKNDYSWSTLKYRTEDGYDNVKFSKYVAESKYGSVDNRSRLELSDDAARANWGGSWRMPTRAEQDELREQCSWQWTTVNGHNGYRVTSKRNGRSIFLPAAGCRLGGSSSGVGSDGSYWSSSLSASYSYHGYGLLFYSSNVGWNSGSRRHGRSVRAVSE